MLRRGGGEGRRGRGMLMRGTGGPRGGGGKRWLLGGAL